MVFFLQRPAVLLPLKVTVGHSQLNYFFEEFKETVARDLEALLNTRAVIPDDTLQGFPECSNSLVTYSLTDFAGLHRLAKAATLA